MLNFVASRSLRSAGLARRPAQTLLPRTSDAALYNPKNVAQLGDTMKMPSILKKSALGLVCGAVLLSPVAASAQAAAPAPHAHAAAPGGETAAAPDFMAAMSKMQSEMQAMKMSGDTDHDFAMMMRSHHQGAIDMAKTELARGKDKQLKQMAQKMVTEQTNEIAKLDKWMAQHASMKK